MTRRTYSNAINTTEVSVAIERLLIADYPNSWTPSRVDLDSLPSGFVDLGAVAEDTPSFQVSREKFQLQTGIPMVLQYESIMGMSGTLAAQLHSNSWRKVQYALGNYTAVSSSTIVATISSVAASAASAITIATTTASLCVGRQITITANTLTIDRADAFETRITSITANGLTLAINPTLPVTFAVGSLISIYQYVKQPVGGRAIRYFTILGVSDFIDGQQVVHHVHKASPANDWTEEFRPNANGRVPLSFNMIGVEQDVRGCTELIIADRYMFPSVCGNC